MVWILECIFGEVAICTYQVTHTSRWILLFLSIEEQWVGMSGNLAVCWTIKQASKLLNCHLHIVNRVYSNMWWVCKPTCVVMECWCIHTCIDRYQNCVGAYSMWFCVLLLRVHFWSAFSECSMWNSVKYNNKYCLTSCVVVVFVVVVVVVLVVFVLFWV